VVVIAEHVLKIAPSAIEPTVSGPTATAKPDSASASDNLTTPSSQRTSVDIRGAALAVIAVLASVFALRWASAVIIPLMVGLTVSYALNPAVDALEHLRLPRALGAALVLALVFGATGWTLYRVSSEAGALIESLPETAKKVKSILLTNRGPSESAIEKVQRTAMELEVAAQADTSPPTQTRKGVTRVQIERPQLNLQDYLWTGTVGLATFMGQAVSMLFIAYFLLVAGDTFRRKMVKITGPTFAKKKVTVQAMNEITAQIQRHLLVQVLMSLIVGVSTWAAFWALRVEHPEVWGVAACLLNFIPYIGSLAITGASVMVGFVQFGTLDMALWIGGVSMLLHAITGYLVAPWLTSRTSRLNPVSVFVGVLAFGWLWGAWGLLLGVPILMMVKAICDRVEDFQPVGELLGR
jgi:predicted PurR-regulated permease PerM